MPVGTTAPTAAKQSAYQELLGQGYTPEQIEAIIGLSGLGSEEGDLASQQDYADMLRTQESPQGNNMGRVYVAANPLEHLGHGMQRQRGETLNKGIDSRQREIWEEQMRRRIDFLRKGANREPAHVGTGVPGVAPVQVTP